MIKGAFPLQFCFAKLALGTKAAGYHNILVALSALGGSIIKSCAKHTLTYGVAMTIEWYDDLLTGHNLIDEQHKELFNRVNKLLEAFTHGRGREEVLETMGFMDEYVIRHFRDEEDIQEQYAYPGIFQHRELHRDFRKNINNLRKHFEKEGIRPHLIILANHTLVDWLISHICEQDKMLAEFIRKQKAKDR